MEHSIQYKNVSFSFKVSDNVEYQEDFFFFFFYNLLSETEEK